MNRHPLHPRGGVNCQETYPGCDYTAEEREFLIAMDRYKRSRQRPHPSWREVLDVLKALGYRKVAAAEAMPGSRNPEASPST